MKEFFLAILKNIITYVAMIVIVIVGGISISTQKFPPNWGEVVSAINTLKNSYVSMLNLRQQMGGMMNMQHGIGTQVPDLASIESDAAASLEKHDSPNKKSDADMQMTLALVQSMGQQLTQQKQIDQVHENAVPQALNPEFKKYLETIQKQNEDMINRMDKIHVYLAGLHQYLAETRRQPSAVAQAVQTHPIAPPTVQQPAQQPLQNQPVATPSVGPK